MADDPATFEVLAVDLNELRRIASTHRNLRCAVNGAALRTTPTRQSRVGDAFSTCRERTLGENREKCAEIP